MLTRANAGRRAISAVIGMTVLFASTAGWAATQWQAYTYAPAALASFKGLEALAVKLGEVTGGELQVTVSPGGSLPINAQDIPQAIGDGVIQLGGTGSYAGYVPIGGIGRLPLLYDTPEELETALEVLDPYLRPALEEKNVILLGHYYYAVQTVWSRAPMDSLDDIKGKKFRVVAPEQAAAVQRLGAVPVAIMTPEVATSLQRGAIDMLLTSASGGGKLWYEMLDTNYRLPVSWALELILVNKDAFEALSPEQQQKVREAGEESGRSITRQLLEEDGELTKRFASEGLTVKDPTAEEIEQARDLVRPFWDEWANEKGDQASEALQKIRAALGK